MTTFYFVRSGKVRQDDSPEPLRDPGLSEAGRQQAALTGQQLAKEPICCVYASPLRRAAETADQIAAHCGGDGGKRQVELTPALRERISWGDLPGQSWSEFQALWQRCNQDRKFVPPYGDSAIDAGSRLEAFCLAVLRKPPQAAVIGVTHYGILTDFLLNLSSHKDLERVNPVFAADPYGAGMLSECSLTTVRFDGYSMKVLGIGEVGHLHAN